MFVSQSRSAGFKAWYRGNFNVNPKWAARDAFYGRGSRPFAGFSRGRESCWGRGTGRCCVEAQSELPSISLRPAPDCRPPTADRQPPTLHVPPMRPKNPPTPAREKTADKNGSRENRLSTHLGHPTGEDGVTRVWGSVQLDMTRLPRAKCPPTPIVAIVWFAAGPACTSDKTGLPEEPREVRQFGRMKRLGCELPLSTLWLKGNKIVEFAG